MAESLTAGHPTAGINPAARFASLRRVRLNSSAKIDELVERAADVTIRLVVLDRRFEPPGEGCDLVEAVASGGAFEPVREPLQRFIVASVVRRPELFDALGHFANEQFDQLAQIGISGQRRKDDRLIEKREIHGQTPRQPDLPLVRRPCPACSLKPYFVASAIAG